MTFPATPLPIGVDLYIGGAWVDLAAAGDVYSRDAVQVRRGKSSEGARIDPGSLAVTLNNRAGDYSPRNPTGTHYGSIGRNTPARAWVKNGQPRTVLDTPSDKWTTPDSASLSITGDLDLRMTGALPSWRPATPTLAGIYKGGSYSTFVTALGLLALQWSTNGVDFLSEASTEPIPGGKSGPKTLRATLDVDNGAGGYTVTFYHSVDGIDGTWLQLGDAITTSSGTTSIYDSAEEVAVYTGTRAEWDVLEIRSGIAGTVVARPEFTAETDGTTSFADAQGNTWTAQGTAEVTTRHYRIHAEATDWTINWDQSGTDVTTRLTCDGMLRRLNQGTVPVRSPFYRGALAIGSTLQAYWPCEDGPTAQHLESPLPGVSNGILYAPATPAAYDGFVSSGPLPTMSTGRLYFPCPDYTNTDQLAVRWLGVIPDTTPNSTLLARIFTRSSLAWADLTYTTGGTLTLKTYNRYGVLNATLGPVAFGVDNKKLRWSIEFQKNGTGVDLDVTILEEGATLAYTSGTTAPTITLGTCYGIWLNRYGADLGGGAFGHVTVESTVTSLFDLESQLNAYTGESAADRITRVATENSLSAEVLAVGELSTVLGFQPRSGVLALLQEAEETDGGALIERRDALALQYRTREHLQNQDVATALTYTDGALTQFQPVEDDRSLANKVTVTRTGGSSGTVEDTTGPLSTADPTATPPGAGLYETTRSLSLYHDDQAVQQAGWAVHLGTVDEARYPTITVNLAHPVYVADQALTRRLLSLDIGDRLTVADLPAWMPPDTVDQLVIGMTERIAQYEHTISFACQPASPWHTATFDSASADLLDTRWDTDTSTLNGAHNSTTTSLAVTEATTGVDWSHTDGDFDIGVAGERMTVTAVSGSSGSFTFTVTRSANGVVKSHTTGTKVSLWSPSYWSL